MGNSEGGIMEGIDDLAVIRWLNEEPRFDDGKRFHEREPPHYRTEAEREKRLAWLARDPRVLLSAENLKRIEADVAEHHAKQGPNYNPPVIGGTPTNKSAQPVEQAVPQKVEPKPEEPARRGFWSRMFRRR